MTPFALNALRPTAAVQAVKPNLASEAGLPTAGGQRGAAFAQLLTQHQAAPVSPALPAAPRPAAAQPLPAAATHAPEHSNTPPHEHAAAAHATDSAAPAAPAHEAASVAADDASSDASAADAPAATASNTRGTTRGAKGTANARPAAGTAHPPSAQGADAAGLTATGEGTETQRADDAASANPLATLLPGWTPPTVPGSATAFAPGAAAGEHAGGTSAGDDAATGAADHGAFKGIGNTHDPRAQPGLPTDDTRQASIALPSSTSALARDAASALPALAAQAQAEREAGSSGAHTGSAPLGDFASHLAQLSGPTGAAPGASAAAPVDVQLMTPATAPEFPEALGAQVSLLAQDGVQHAELHLNPAEMGPISVRIAIEGQQAQIDFGADSAQTRQLLEAGLPELASALRDAGLTLSGGGVSQHPQPQQQGGRDAGDSKGGDRGSSARVHGADKDTAGALAPLSAAQTRSLARRAAGGIDAYA